MSLVVSRQRMLDGAPGNQFSETFSGTEEIAADVISSNSATDPGNGQRPVFRITAEGDRWITIGPAPANPAVAGRRLLFKASEGLQQDFYVDPGDRIRAVAVA